MLTLDATIIRLSEEIMPQPLVFISYSHRDEDWKDRLVTHLGVLRAQGMLSLWDDRRIAAGEDWEQTIKGAMRHASLAILLISANSLTSEFILRTEVASFIKRREKEGLHVFPIVIKPCDWQAVDWLRKMNLRPKDGRPLSSGNEHQIDADLADVAREIRHLIPALSPTKNLKRSRTAIELSNADSMKWSLVLEGTYNDLSKAQAEKIARELQLLLGDSHLVIRKIEKGSIILHLESSRAAFERLKYLFDSGHFSQILNLKVLRVTEDMSNTRSIQYSPRQFGTVMYAHDRFYSGVLVRLLQDLEDSKEADAEDMETDIGHALEKVTHVYERLERSFFLRETLLPRLRMFKNIYGEWSSARLLARAPWEALIIRQNRMSQMRKVRRQIVRLISQNQIFIESQLGWSSVIDLYASMAILRKHELYLPHVGGFLRRAEATLLPGSISPQFSRNPTPLVPDPINEFRLVIRRLLGKNFERTHAKTLNNWSRENLRSISPSAFRAFRDDLIRSFEVEREFGATRLNPEMLLYRCSALLERSDRLGTWKDTAG